GSVNPKGLEFYKNFIHELELNHIYVTLYHYDHPQSLEDKYGEETKKKEALIAFFCQYCSKDFTAYADVCFREFGSHVKFWTTINEANIFSTGGYNNRVTPLGRLFGLLLRELFH
ncbi:hypothetical protein HID58_016739, partial [Brassica napus]